MRSDWKEKVVRRFDHGAHQYNEHNDIQAIVAERLAAMLPDSGVQSVLEIGCGTGVLTKHLVTTYPDSQFHITDISEAMIHQAQANIAASSDIQWSVLDGEDITDQTKYDLIVSNMAFQWFEQPEQSFRKIIKLLNPEGRLLFTVPSSQSFKEWRASLSELSLQYGFSHNFDWPSICAAEDIVIDYDNTLNFLRTLKRIGANVPYDGYIMLPPSAIKKACKINDDRFGGKTTWHILYGSMS